MENRDHQKLVCPNCNHVNSKEAWDNVTRMHIPLFVSTKDAIHRRDLYGDNEFICPTCRYGIPLRDIVHEH